ncbi:MAG: terminase small subunit [Rhodomicrobium sp.]
MRDPNEFAEIKLPLSRKLSIDQERVVEGIAEIAFADGVSAYLDSSDNAISIRSLGELTPRQARAIKSVSVDAGGGVKLEFYDRLAAFDKLAKVLDLYGGTSINVAQSFAVNAPAADASRESRASMAQQQFAVAEAARLLDALPSDAPRASRCAPVAPPQLAGWEIAPEKRARVRAIPPPNAVHRDE